MEPYHHVLFTPLHTGASSFRLQDMFLVCMQAPELASNFDMLHVIHCTVYYVYPDVYIFEHAIAMLPHSSPPPFSACEGIILHMIALLLNMLQKMYFRT